MKINAGEIRVGMILEHKNELWEVLKTQHVKPGKGGAFAQVEMKSVNKIILVGHLGAKPEGRYTPQGVSTASFSIATNEAWYDHDKNKHEHTEWHNIVVFNQLADFVTFYY